MTGSVYKGSINTPELLSSLPAAMENNKLEKRSSKNVSFFPVGETLEKKDSNTLKLVSADLPKKGIQPTVESGHYKDITKHSTQ